MCGCGWGCGAVHPPCTNPQHPWEICILALQRVETAGRSPEQGVSCWLVNECLSASAYVCVYIYVYMYVYEGARLGDGVSMSEVKLVSIFP